MNLKTRILGEIESNKQRYEAEPYYVAIVEETTIHLIEVPIKDYEGEDGAGLSKRCFAKEGWKQGYYCDNDPHLDGLEVLEIREGEDAWL